MIKTSVGVAALALAASFSTAANAQIVTSKQISLPMAVTIATTAIETCKAQGYNVSVHVIGNMVYLWIFGDNIEDRLGSGPYLVFYVLCGIVAAIGQGLVQPEPMVGASGAIAGVLGAYVVLFPAARVSTLVFLGIFITIVQLPALVVIGFFIVLQVIDALAELRLTAHQATANIAYFAHIFGFVAGILLLLLIRQRREEGRFRFG